MSIRRVYVEREGPVLAHGGVVDVHDEVLAWTGARCEPVRAPLTPPVLELLDVTDMRHVSADDLPAEVAKRDVEAAAPLLHTVAGVPECLLLLDGVLDRFYLVYHDEQVEELRVLAHRHVCGLVLLNNTVCICRLEIFVCIYYICIYDTLLRGMDCACKTYHEEQLDLLLEIMGRVIYTTREEYENLKHEISTVNEKPRAKPLQYLLKNLLAWQTSIETVTNDGDGNTSPTWTGALLKILRRMQADIHEFMQAKDGLEANISVQSGLSQYDRQQETNSIIKDRKLRVETAHEHTCTTLLELLLHMFDVPRKVIYSAGEHEEIEDFYPPEQNYHILLYNDPDNNRLKQQKNTENIQLLRQCAIYLLILPLDNGAVLQEKRALKLHQDLTRLKSMLHARTLAGYKSLHEAIKQLMEFA